MIKALEKQACEPSTRYTIWQVSATLKNVFRKLIQLLKSRLNIYTNQWYDFFKKKIQVLDKVKNVT